MSNRSLMLKATAALVVVGVVAAGALAVTIAGTEATGAGGQFYKLVVTDVITGPIGKAAGVAGIAYGAIKIFQNPMLALFPIAGGVGIFKAADIANSFGALI